MELELRTREPVLGVEREHLGSGIALCQPRFGCLELALARREHGQLAVNDVAVPGFGQQVERRLEGGASPEWIARLGLTIGNGGRQPAQHSLAFLKLGKPGPGLLRVEGSTQCVERSIDGQAVRRLRHVERVVREGALQLRLEAGEPRDVLDGRGRGRRCLGGAHPHFVAGAAVAADHDAASGRRLERGAAVRALDRSHRQVERSLWHAPTPITPTRLRVRSTPPSSTRTA